MNFPAFHAAATELRAQGHHVENPAEINADTTTPWLECMRTDLALLVTCDAVYLLPGWQNSRGARIEQSVAAGLGLGLLLLAMLAATLLLGRLTWQWSRHVARVERDLGASASHDLPTLALTGERELDRVLAALNQAGSA